MYHEYCDSRDMKTHIFKMKQQECKILKDYVERFLYKLHKFKHGSLNKDSIKTIFFKGIKEEYIATLNLISFGGMSQKYFQNICDLCKKYSRSRDKEERGGRDTFSRHKFVVGVIRTKL